MKFPHPPIHRKKSIWQVVKLFSFFTSVATLLLLLGDFSSFRWWPLGILLGTFFQITLKGLGQQAVRRTLIANPQANEFFSQLLIFSPLGTSLRTQRHWYVTALREGRNPTEENAEQKSWEKLMPRLIFLVTGLWKLQEIDSLDRWCKDQAILGRLPSLSSLEKRGLVLALILIPTILTLTHGWKEFALFYILPAFFLAPAFQRQVEVTGTRTSRDTSLQVFETPSLP